MVHRSLMSSYNFRNAFHKARQATSFYKVNSNEKAVSVQNIKATRLVYIKRTKAVRPVYIKKGLPCIAARRSYIPSLIWLVGKKLAEKKTNDGVA